VRLSLSREKYEIVEAISYSGHFGYKYPADFLRDAIRVLIDKLSSEEHLSQLVTEYNTLQAERYQAMLEVLARKVHKRLAKSLREAYFAGSGTLTSTAATICHLRLRHIQVSVHTYRPRSPFRFSQYSLPRTTAASP
jgi:hypothetical protein